MENSTDYSYRRAKERVGHIKSFYMSLFAYCIVISFLTYLNLRTTRFLWVLFPALGWGMGLVSQWMSAFGYNPLFGKHWEERKINEFMNNREF